MQRVSKDQYYLDIAKSVTERSTCLRRNYGAIIVKDDEVISTGYNGAPRGEMNCCECGFCQRDAMGIPKGERYELCLAGNTVIKLLDGTYRTIQDLAENGPESVWVYSVDTKTGKIVPAKAENIRKTKHVTSMVRVHFGQGAVECTHDHKFMLRNGKYKKAGDLRPGDSIMPMYYNFAEYDHESVSNGPKMIEEGRWAREGCIGTTHGMPTHLLVYRAIHGEIPDGYLVHHKNFKARDNTPENLEAMTSAAHSALHNSTPEKKAKAFGGKEGMARGRATMIRNLRNNPEAFERLSKRSRAIMQRNWENPEWAAHLRASSARNAKNLAQKYNSDPEVILRRRQTVVAKSINLLRYRMSCGDDAATEITPDNYNALRKKYAPHAGKGAEVLVKLDTIYKYFDTFDEAIEAGKHYNHKVTEVETFDCDCDVYDMEVPKYHNFAVDLGDNSCVFVHNCVSVHAEANAIISAARRDMIGATIYIVGIEAKDGSFANPAPCMMCRRLIKNAGIVRCVGLVDGVPVNIPLDPPANEAPAAKKEEYVNSLLKGGYVAVPVYASYSLLAHAGKAEVENNPTVVLGVKQDYLEAYARDRHYSSLEAFMENYTLDVTEDLEEGAALQDALAFVYSGDILPNQGFSYLSLAEPAAVKAYLDFTSKLLNNQGNTEVAKELTKLAAGIGSN